MPSIRDLRLKRGCFIWCLQMGLTLPADRMRSETHTTTLLRNPKVSNDLGSIGFRLRNGQAGMLDVYADNGQKRDGAIAGYPRVLIPKSEGRKVSVVSPGRPQAAASQDLFHLGYIEVTSDMTQCTVEDSPPAHSAFSSKQALPHPSPSPHSSDHR